MSIQVMEPREGDVVAFVTEWPDVFERQITVCQWKQGMSSVDPLDRTRVVKLLSYEELLLKIVEAP